MVRNARGQKVGHHLTYELGLDDGRILRTRISHPVNEVTCGASLWHAVLREQLDVTEEVFWACVQHKELPDRGGVESQPAEKALPAELVYQLIFEVGVPEAAVRQMTMPEAVAALQEYWSRPRT